MFVSIFSDSPKSNVVMAPCVENDRFNEKWELTEFDQIRQINLNLCLDTENLNAQDHVFVRTCDSDRETQKWMITHWPTGM